MNIINEVSKTARQSIPCFNFDLSVEKKGKQYIYTICREGRKLFQYIHKDPPELQNPTGQVVRGFLKKMSGEVTIKSEDVEAAVSDDKIRDKIMETLTWLGDLLLAYEDNKEQFKAELEAEKLEKQKDELTEKADKFLELLEEKHCTIIEFCEYLSEWLAGGESKNIMTGFICHLSTYFLIKAVWFMVLGGANEGKTVIDDAATAMMPEDAVLNGLVTDSAIHRKALTEGRRYLDGKILKMADLGGQKDFDKWERTLDIYKKLSTDGLAELEVTSESVDMELGERTAISFVVEGNPSVSLTSVNSEDFNNGQYLSRGVTVSPDATNEDVYKFFYFNKGRYAQKRDYIINHEGGLLHQYIQYTREFYHDAKVINPYWTCLEKWFRSSEFYKRGLGLYSSLVEGLTLLNQNTRESIDIGDDLYLVSTKEDNELVANLFNPSNGISEPAVRLFNLLLKWFSKFNPDELSEYESGDLGIKDCKTMFTVGVIRHKASKIRILKGLDYGEIIWSLVSRDMIEKVGKVNRGRDNLYTISRFEELQSTRIDFDEDKISKYVKDLEGMYSIPPHTLFEIIDREKAEKSSKRPNTSLEYPPWCPQVPQSVPQGAARCLKPDPECLKVPENAEVKSNNRDKCEVKPKKYEEPTENPLKQVEKEWEAYL